MAEKDGSARWSATAEAGEKTEAEHRQKSRKSMKENKPYLAHSKSDWERQADTRSRPSDVCGTPRGLLDRSLQAQLGRQLRAIFSDVEQEPIPDRFIRLLEALEKREKGR
ncbi:MAG TPA: NepR family anti-sigma factor [Hyphomicrobiaceae bacterium]|jgi:hypothetical protein|nr:NepR family anti-sigma factor [Hyphomicrobiaceae bacterium]